MCRILSILMLSIVLVVQVTIPFALWLLASCHMSHPFHRRRPSTSDRTLSSTSLELSLVERAGWRPHMAEMIA